MNTLIIISVILIVLVVVGMIIAIMVNNEAERKRKTLSVIRGGSASEKTESKDDIQNKRRAEIAKKLKESGEIGGSQKKSNLKMSLAQAGLEIEMKHYWIGSLISGLVCVALAFFLSGQIFLVIMAGIIGFMGLPRLFVKRKIKKRQKQFLEEFPDALEAMVRLLKAGMPVTEAIAMASREFTGPVGDEMSRMYDAQRIGVSLPDAALDGARRMPITEMQMFSTAIAIQTQTGASLGEVLQNLADVIRSRFKLKRKVQALSSEAKSSAMIIGALPFLVGGGLFAINPEYMDLMINTLPGKIMLVGSAVWMCIGIMVMKVMINFKV